MKYDGILVKEVDMIIVHKGLENLEKRYGKRCSHSVEKTGQTYVVTCLSDDLLAVKDLELYLKSHDLRFGMILDSQHNIYTIPMQQRLEWDKIKQLSKFRDNKES